MRKWYTYQKERFPLLEYTLLMVVFASAGITYANRLQVLAAPLPLYTYLIATVTTLIWFALMRIADEHKDYADDMLYRPYRPVQRGLVSLKALRTLGVVLVCMQLALSFWVAPVVGGVLLLGYVWFALISREFFVPVWLKKRPMVYLLSHMVIMAVIGLHITAFSWGWSLATFGEVVTSPDSQLTDMGWFLLASYFNGAVIEVGRKIRPAAKEETGVETYSALFGITKAVRLWLVFTGLSLLAFLYAGALIGIEWLVGLVLLPLFAVACIASRRFTLTPTEQTAVVFKILPSLWVLISYLTLWLGGVFAHAIF